MLMRFFASVQRMLMNLYRLFIISAVHSGGINLEDIAAPRCFEIEQKLKEMCDIPIFHDDQHGTAVVVSGRLLSMQQSLPASSLGECKAVITDPVQQVLLLQSFLASLGLKDVILCDRTGAIYEGREGPNASKEDIAKVTNREMTKGTLKGSCCWHRCIYRCICSGCSYAGND